LIQLSAVVIAKNEEHNIARCLESLNFTDEIIVIDSGSTDRTIELAREFGAKIHHIEWSGFGPAKKYAVDRAAGEWILSVDADEEITGLLASEIKSTINSGNISDGYFIPRRTNFLGRWINHSRWYPDYVLRLFRKEKGQFSEALVHEQVLIAGKVGKLTNHIKHFSYPDTKTFFEKLDRYTTLGAQELMKKGRRFSLFALICKPVASFCSHYVFGAGFLDGLEGFMIAVLSAYGVFVKYVKLYSMGKTTTSNESSAR
jgi:glycosyltransferase involved in cell wall biosynthesis